MSTNPPLLRPDLSRPEVPDTRRAGQPTIGMVSLAHAGDATTVDSQIFIVIGPASHTEGKYPIFGKVITGLDVVRKLAVEDRIIRATVKGAT